MKTQTPTKPKAASPRSRKSSGQSAATNNEERQKMIAEAAYYRAMNRGFNGGDEMEDWLAAESEIDSMFRH